MQFFHWADWRWIGRLSNQMSNLIVLDKRNKWNWINTNYFWLIRFVFYYLVIQVEETSQYFVGIIASIFFDCNE